LFLVTFTAIFRNSVAAFDATTMPRPAVRVFAKKRKSTNPFFQPNRSPLQKAKSQQVIVGTLFRADAQPVTEEALS
jgi:hypothetical protein